MSNRLDVPVVGGQLTPIVLGANLLKGTPKGIYEVPLMEQATTGEMLGAFALAIVQR